MDTPVSWSDMNRIVASLSARLSALEALLTPKASGVITDHHRFIPDYGSEGEY